MTERETSNLPVNYKEQMAKEVAEMQSRIAAPSGDKIKYNKNTSFILPDGSEGPMLSVVIVDFLSTNLYYDRPYVPDSPTAPACFAIGMEPILLAPSKNSPAIQSDSCGTCEQNKFGTALNGKGKACRNFRLLAVADPSKGNDSPIWVLPIPPASIKSFDTYVTMLATKLGMPPVGVITEITLDHTNDYASPRFAMGHPLDGGSIGMFIERKDEARKRLMTEPDVSQYEPPKARPTPARSAVTRK